jgi:mono/diheme cytochrome c family protein
MFRGPRRAAFALLTGALAAIACASPFVRPSSADVVALRPIDPGVQLADLERGRSLYLAKCASCHQLHEPSLFAPEAWPDKVHAMQREGRVHLSDPEALDMIRYLRAASLVARR